MPNLYFSLVAILSVVLFGTGYYMTSPPTKTLAQLSEYDHAWVTWKQTHGKTYGVASDEQYRKSVFVENFDFIKDFNAKSREKYGNHPTTHVLALNRFADVTNKEFRATRAGFKKPQQKLLAAKAEEPTQLLTCANVDNEINWKERGHVTPVRNQGQCGSCWAFSTTAAMESHYHIHGRGDLEWISPQQLIDCTGDLGEMGCNGGNFDAAFQYGSMHMIQKDVDYPYKAEKGAQCLHDASKDATGVHITSWRDIQKNSPSQILCALQNGPVSVAINAGLAVQFYFGGVVRHLCGDSIDHAVTLVGRKCGKQPWWEHSPFKHAGDECYWIIKNSWGADYGDKGYTYILDEQKEGSTGMCGVNMMAAQPTI